jgi:uncharacterized membrane protein
MARALSKGKVAGLGFVFLWFFAGGLAHFAKTDLEMRIMPPYIPWPRAAVLVSGVFELLGALGIVYGPTRRAAGMGLLALTIAVTPANIFMWQHADRFPGVSPTLLLLRLPLQVVLIACILWSTQRRR